MIRVPAVMTSTCIFGAIEMNAVVAIVSARGTPFIEGVDHEQHDGIPVQGGCPTLAH
jgi:hypothetical protein